MSVKVSTDVLRAGYQSATAKLVMLAIANRADDSGGNAWPTQAELAEAAMCSVRTVVRTVAALVDAGHLEVEHHAGGSEDRIGADGRRPNLYRITDSGRVGCQVVVQPRKPRAKVVRQTGIQPTEVGCQTAPSWMPNHAQLDAKPPTASSDDATSTSFSVHPSLNKSGCSIARDMSPGERAHADAAAAASHDGQEPTALPLPLRAGHDAQIVDEVRYSRQPTSLLAEALELLCTIRWASATSANGTQPNPSAWKRPIVWEWLRKAEELGWLERLAADPECRHSLVGEALGRSEFDVYRRDSNICRPGGWTMRQPASIDYTPLPATAHPSTPHDALPHHAEHRREDGTLLEGCTCDASPHTTCALDTPWAATA